MQDAALRAHRLNLFVRHLSPIVIQEKSEAFPDTSRPMIRPKRPRTELKISMTKILTNLHSDQRFGPYLCKHLGSYKLGSAASARAAELPLMPTETPHIRLHVPTVMPAQNSAYPV
jgi:hypothetical protein